MENSAEVKEEKGKLPLQNVVGSAVKPPLGVCPKDIWERNNRVDRLHEVRGAIVRYYDAGLKINIEWIEEYNELIESVSGG